MHRLLLVSLLALGLTAPLDQLRDLMGLREAGVITRSVSARMSTNDMSMTTVGYSLALCQQTSELISLQCNICSKTRSTGS